MAYRSGTYVAFDGLGESDPSKSDFKYYSTIKMWDSHNSIDFSITNSHEKASSVRDSSKLATLKSSIQQRLRNSKNIVIILSDDTRKTGSILSYEIELAVDNYDLPLIIAYTGYININNPKLLSSRWPKALEKRINDGTAKAIHVSFKKEPILDAIGQFIVDQKYPKGGALGVYGDDVYKKWGLGGS